MAEQIAAQPLATQASFNPMQLGQSGVVGNAPMFDNNGELKLKPKRVGVGSTTFTNNTLVDIRGILQQTQESVPAAIQKQADVLTKDIGAFQDKIYETSISQFTEMREYVEDAKGIMGRYNNRMATLESQKFEIGAERKAQQLSIMSSDVKLLNTPGRIWLNKAKTHEQRQAVFYGVNIDLSRNIYKELIRIRGAVGGSDKAGMQLNTPIDNQLGILKALDQGIRSLPMAISLPYKAMGLVAAIPGAAMGIWNWIKDIGRFKEDPMSLLEQSGYDIDNKTAMENFLGERYPSIAQQQMDHMKDMDISLKLIGGAIVGQHSHWQKEVTTKIYDSFTNKLYDKDSDELKQIQNDKRETLQMLADASAPMFFGKERFERESKAAVDTAMNAIENPALTKAELNKQRKMNGGQTDFEVDRDNRVAYRNTTQAMIKTGTGVLAGVAAIASAGAAIPVLAAIAGLGVTGAAVNRSSRASEAAELEDLSIREQALMREASVMNIANYKKMIEARQKLRALKAAKARGVDVSNLDENGNLISEDGGFIGPPNPSSQDNQRQIGGASTGSGISNGGLTIDFIDNGNFGSFADMQLEQTQKLIDVTTQGFQHVIDNTWISAFVAANDETIGVSSTPQQLIAAACGAEVKNKPIARKLGGATSGYPSAMNPPQQPYLIGEEGPEIMVPSGKGTIVPLDLFKGQLQELIKIREILEKKMSFMFGGVDFNFSGEAGEGFSSFLGSMFEGLGKIAISPLKLFKGFTFKSGDGSAIDGFSDFIGSTFKGVSELLKTSGGKLLEGFNFSGEGISSFVTNAFGLLESGISKLGFDVDLGPMREGLLEFGSKAMGWISDLDLGGKMSSFLNSAKEKFDWGQLVLGGIYDAAREKIGEGITQLKGWWDSTLPVIKEKLVNASMTIQRWVGEGIGKVQHVTEQVRDWWKDYPLREKLSNMGAGIQRFVGETIGRAQLAISGVVDGIKSRWKGFKDKISAPFRKGKELLTKGITAIKEGIGGFFGLFKKSTHDDDCGTEKKIKKVRRKVCKWISTLFGNIFRAIAEVAPEPKEGMIGKMLSGFKTLGKKFKETRDATNIGMSNITNRLPGFAEGGQPKDDVLAMINAQEKITPPAILAAELEEQEKQTETLETLENQGDKQYKFFQKLFEPVNATGEFFQKHGQSMAEGLKPDDVDRKNKIKDRLKAIEAQDIAEEDAEIQKERNELMQELVDLQGKSKPKGKCESFLGGLISSIGGILAGAGGFLATMFGKFLPFTMIGKAIGGLFTTLFSGAFWGKIISGLGSMITKGKTLFNLKNLLFVGKTSVIGTVIFGAIDIIIDAFSGFSEGGASGLISGIFKTGEGGFMSALKGMGKYAAIGFAAGSFIPVIGNVVGAIIGGALGMIVGWIGENDEGQNVVQQFGGWIWDTITAPFKKFFDILGKGLDCIGLTDFVDGIKIDICTWFRKPFDTLKYAFNEYLRKPFNVFMTGMEVIWTDFKNDILSLPRAISGWWNNITGRWTDLIDSINNWLGKNKEDDPRGFFEKIADAVTGFVTGIWDFLMSPIRALFSGASMLGGYIKKALMKIPGVKCLLGNVDEGKSDADVEKDNKKRQEIIQKTTQTDSKEASTAKLNALKQQKRDVSWDVFGSERAAIQEKIDKERERNKTLKERGALSIDAKSQKINDLGKQAGTKGVGVLGKEASDRAKELRAYIDDNFFNGDEKDELAKLEEQAKLQRARLLEEKRILEIQLKKDISTQKQVEALQKQAAAQNKERKVIEAFHKKMEDIQKGLETTKIEYEKAKAAGDKDKMKELEAKMAKDTVTLNKMINAASGGKQDRLNELDKQANIAEIKKLDKRFAEDKARLEEDFTGDELQRKLSNLALDYKSERSSLEAGGIRGKLKGDMLRKEISRDVKNVGAKTAGKFLSAGEHIDVSRASGGVGQQEAIQRRISKLQGDQKNKKGQGAVAGSMYKIADGAFYSNEQKEIDDLRSYLKTIGGEKAKAKPIADLIRYGKVKSEGSVNDMGVDAHNLYVKFAAATTKAKRDKILEKVKTKGPRLQKAFYQYVIKGRQAGAEEARFAAKDAARVDANIQDLGLPTSFGQAQSSAEKGIAKLVTKAETVKRSFNETDIGQSVMSNLSGASNFNWGGMINDAGAQASNMVSSASGMVSSYTGGNDLSKIAKSGEKTLIDLPGNIEEKSKIVIDKWKAMKGSKPAEWVPDIKSKEDIMAYVMRNEGWDNNVYMDSLGKPTIGVGHLIRAGENFTGGLTNEEVIALFYKDFDKHAEGTAKTPGFAEANASAQAAMIDLGFNMGTGILTKYKSLKNKIGGGDYASAASQLRGWKWATQVGPRRVNPTTNLLAMGGDNNGGELVALAEGGTMGPLSLVGEKGPELRVNQQGTIIPLDIFKDIRKGIAIISSQVVNTVKGKTPNKLTPTDLTDGFEQTTTMAQGGTTIINPPAQQSPTVVPVPTPMGQQQQEDPKNFLGGDDHSDSISFALMDATSGAFHKNIEKLTGYVNSPTFV